jgi:hypothetical protein
VEQVQKLGKTAFKKSLAKQLLRKAWQNSF